MDKLGNPAVVAALAQNPQAVNKIGKAVKWLSLLSVTVVGTYFIWDKTKKSRAIKAMNKGTTEVSQALILRAAMIRWGAGLLPKVPFIKLPTIPDGTNESMLYQIASEVKDWPQVQKDYNVIFGTPLAEDLMSELNIDDFRKFFKILDAGNKNTSTDPYPKGTSIYALKDNVPVFNSNKWNEIQHYVNRGDKIGIIEDILTVTIGGKKKTGYRVKNCAWHSWISGCDTNLRVYHADVTNDESLTGLTNLL